MCSRSWDDNDAQVACRQLGFLANGAITLTGMAVTYGTGNIWLDNVGCVGTENRLVDCSSNGLGVSNCFHSEDVGVSCQPSE